MNSNLRCSEEWFLLPEDTRCPWAWLLLRIEEEITWTWTSDSFSFSLGQKRREKLTLTAGSVEHSDRQTERRITTGWWTMMIPSSSSPKFGVRFLTRKERTVRRVTKCETREIQKRLSPPAVVSPAKKAVQPRLPVVRPKPATLVKVREVKRPPPPVVPSSPGRVLQSTDLQKLSRLSCSHEFSLFHKEIKPDLKSNEHQLAFFETKLYHLKNEFVNQMSQQLNLEQIREYFSEQLKKNYDRQIHDEEFPTLAEKLKQDIKQVRERTNERISGWTSGFFL